MSSTDSLIRKYENIELWSLDNGRCVVVQWDEERSQYRTARYQEVPQGGYRYGRRPHQVGHSMSRSYAMAEFRRLVKELKETGDFGYRPVKW